VSHAWPRPDFLATSTPRRPAIAWLLSAAALVVVALAANDWQAARRELVAQQARLARASQRAPLSATRPRASATATGATDAEGARGAQAVVGRIAHPWDRILANVESETPDGLQWLALEHDADDGAVRLEGAAVDVATILRFVDGLGDHGGWTDVALGRLRANDGRDAAAGAPAWRFELNASVDARAIAATRPRGER
jgi:hypothetical protein